MSMRAFVIPVIVSILILGGLGFSQDAFAVGGTISDQTSCEVIGGTWISPDTCLLDFTINDGETLNISSGVIINNTRVESIINSGGTLNNDGTLNITIFIRGDSSDIIIKSGGILNNMGTINIESNRFSSQPGSTLNNIGIINLGPMANFVVRGGQFDNSGTLNISKDSLLTLINIRSLFDDTFFDNSGTININKSLFIWGDYVFGGTINISPDATLEIMDSVITIPDQVICGDGTTLNTVTNECEADVTQAQLDAAESIIAALKLLIANISVAFVQPILDAIDIIPNIADDASLTRTFERSLSTVERADGIACKEATSFKADVDALLADTTISQTEADTLLEKANELLATCTP